MTVQSDEIEVRVLRLRLAIARAAQRDSLSWWDDASLTPDANLLLRRLFPRSVTRAGWALALRAARARHEVVLADWPHVHHLFYLGARFENRLDVVLREQQSFDISQSPIRSRGELAAVLRAIAPAPAPPSVQAPASNRAMPLGDEVASLPVADRATALAWAYTIPDTAGLVVPFYIPGPEPIT